jgi:hypothetical protein
VLAYHLWLERQQQDGYAEQDWLRAEEQLQKARPDQTRLAQL